MNSVFSARSRNIVIKASVKASHKSLQTGFRSERDMLPPVLRWLADQGLEVKSEVATPWGVCDVVGLSFNKARVRQRVRLGQLQPIGSLARIELLRAIPDVSEKRCITLSQLAREVGDVSLDTLISDLDRLIERKFVDEVRPGRFQRLNGWAPLHRRLVAIELKLERVQDVVEQAIRNRAFARESFIALPMPLAERLVKGTLASNLKSACIGLLGVSTTRCSVLVRPSLSSALIHAGLEWHCAERFWRTHLKTIHH